MDFSDPPIIDLDEYGIFAPFPSKIREMARVTRLELATSGGEAAQVEEHCFPVNYPLSNILYISDHRAADDHL